MDRKHKDSVVEAVDRSPAFVVVTPVINGGGLDIGMVRQLLGNRQVMLFDHPGDERPAEVVRHDFHPHLRTALTGNVVDRMLGDTRPGDVATAADAVEQERVVLCPCWQVLTAQVQPRLQLLERMAGRT